MNINNDIGTKVLLKNGSVYVEAGRLGVMLSVEVSVMDDMDSSNLSSIDSISGIPRNPCIHSNLTPTAARAIAAALMLHAEQLERALTQQAKQLKGIRNR